MDSLMHDHLCSGIEIPKIQMGVMSSVILSWNDHKYFERATTALIIRCHSHLAVCLHKMCTESIVYDSETNSHMHRIWQNAPYHLGANSVCRTIVTSSLIMIIINLFALLHDYGPTIRLHPRGLRQNLAFCGHIFTMKSLQKHIDTWALWQRKTNEVANC